MRILRFVGVFLAVGLCLCATNLMGAENPLREHGTLVFRGNDSVQLWLMWDADQQAVLLVSSEPDWGEAALCSDDWSGSARWQEEDLASGKVNYFIKAPVVARLFYPMTPDQIFEIIDAAGGDCGFVKNQPEPFAEGIMRFDYHESNWCAIARPDQNQWAWRAAGSLINLTGDCPGKRIGVSYVEHYRLKPGAVVVDCQTDASNIVVTNWFLNISCIH